MHHDLRYNVRFFVAPGLNHVSVYLCTTFNIAIDISDCCKYKSAMKAFSNSALPHLTLDCYQLIVSD